jgi:hypothetical protein
VAAGSTTRCAGAVKRRTPVKLPPLPDIAVAERALPAPGDAEEAEDSGLSRPREPLSESAAPAGEAALPWRRAT